MQPRIPKVKPGEPVRASLINQIIEAVERNQVISVAGGTMEMKTSAGGTVLRATGSTQVLLKAKAPVGGIAAATGGNLIPGTADCLIYTWDGTQLVIGTDLKTVHNFTGNAVGANKVITIGRLDYGIWEVLLEPC